MLTLGLNFSTETSKKCSRSSSTGRSSVLAEKDKREEKTNQHNNTRAKEGGVERKEAKMGEAKEIRN